MKHTFREIFWSIVGILASGIVGGLAGWLIVNGLDLSGVFAAVLAAIVAMVVATAVWLGITLLLRRIGIVP
jgi:hypothetical protein